MRIVFIGTVEASFQMLKCLLEGNTKVVGVVTTMDHGINSDYADLVPICKQHQTPFLLTTNVNAQETIDWVKSLAPDVIFCLGWSRLIKSELLQLAPLGVIGYHPAALPKNRGRHPLIWALVLGLEKTASTFFFMDEGVDSGDIMSQQEIIISDVDDAQTLYNKVIETGKKQLLEMIPALNSGQYQRIPQQDSRANLWRKRGIQDGKIDWRMSAKSIHNLARGLTRPYIGAHFLKDGQNYKVWKTRVIDCHGLDNIEPGKVVNAVEQSVLIVKCGKGCVELLDVEPALPLSAGDYL